MANFFYSIQKLIGVLEYYRPFLVSPSVLSILDFNEQTEEFLSKIHYFLLLVIYYCIDIEVHSFGQMILSG